MGFHSWFEDLSVSKKCCVVIASGIAVCATGYGFYRACEYIRRCLDKSNKQEDDVKKLAKKVLLLGLDGSGKSAFLASLSQSGNIHREETKPTEGFNVVNLTTDGMEINIWEVGGAEKFRCFWPNFTAGTSVLVYTVDSSDGNRLQESKQTLDNILSDKNLQDVPLILVVSKQDISGAYSAEEVAKVFEVESSLLSIRLVGVVGIQITNNTQNKELQRAKEMILGLCN